MLLFNLQEGNMNEVMLKVNNLREGGNIMIAVYNREDDFLSENVFISVREPVVDDQSQIVKLNIPDGSYAIAVYQDLNSNGELDKNFFGIPTEPYGFSAETVFRMGPPQWADYVITIDSNRQLNIYID